MQINEINNIFEQFLNESYKNIFDEENKKKYAQQVWDLLQVSYDKIGGLKGSGFSSINDMIKSFPMWKLNIINGKVILAALYKDKNGRKFCAGGTDGSYEGKSKFRDFIKAELSLGRAWGEISGPLLRLCQKHYPELLNKTLIPAEEIKKISRKPIEITSPTSYKRKLGNGDEEEKVAFGKFNQLI
mgnify:CR=1 FL=1